MLDEAAHSQDNSEETRVFVPGAGVEGFAAPMWAGYIALANQQAAGNSDSPVGFINPILYTNIGVGANYGSDFHDVTSNCDNSYCAATGFDLVTGWGSPQGQGLIDALVGAALPQAAAPTNSSNYTTEGEECPTIEFTETLYDSTPGAQIYWQLSGNSGNSTGQDPLTSGGSFNLEYQSCTNSGPSGTMYVTAPGYSQSATVPIYF